MLWYGVQIRRGQEWMMIREQIQILWGVNLICIQFGKGGSLRKRITILNTELGAKVNIYLD